MNIVGTYDIFYNVYMYRIFVVSGRDEIYVSRWFAYEVFHFLEDRDMPRKRISTVKKFDVLSIFRLTF